MLDAMMDTLETIAAETCRLEPTYQEEDDKITQEIRDKSTQKFSRTSQPQQPSRRYPRGTTATPRREQSS